MLPKLAFKMDYLMSCTGQPTALLTLYPKKTTLLSLLGALKSMKLLKRSQLISLTVQVIKQLYNFTFRIAIDL